MDDDKYDTPLTDAIIVIAVFILFYYVFID